MKGTTLALIIVSILSIIFAGLVVGIGLQIKLTNYSNELLWRYSCHDGCSIATKDNETGFLTNETWICWDKCDLYIEQIREGYLK